MLLNQLRKIAPVYNLSVQQRFFTQPSLVQLPLLRQVLDKSKQSVSLQDTAIVYTHHALETSVHVMDGIISLGARPRNIFCIAKSYSQCPEVVRKIEGYGVYHEPCSKQTGLGQFARNFTRDMSWLWKNVSDNLAADVKNILVLDHGGYATSFIPAPLLEKYNVIGVEKTTAGLIKLNDQGLPPFPIIDVAKCAAKAILESPLIADAIVQKLIPLIPQNPSGVSCGIIGYGAIGKAVAVKLLSMGYQVMLYDPLETISGLHVTDNVVELIDLSDYIFGCTGRDTIEAIEAFRCAQKDKTLISCSSEDKEFLSLLKAIQKENNMMIADPFAEVRYITPKGKTIRILKGGFPINFDHSGESVPKKDIQLTRALVLTSVLQAARFFNNKRLLKKAGVYALDPEMQRFVVSEWLKYQPTDRFPQRIIERFKDLSWIIETSEGTYVPLVEERQCVTTVVRPPIERLFALSKH